MNVELARPRAVLLDIEGTTTPAAFVYRVLFPFARMHLSEYLAGCGEAAPWVAAVARLRGEYLDDASRGETLPSWSEPGVAGEAAADYAIWLMDRDRKSPGLKTLQGLIWERGYATGELAGQVYPDVPPALVRWQRDGVAVAIYSSGSVLAQQLLFRTTPAGDLTRFLSGYFDTGVGPKASADSYRRIAVAIEFDPPQLLFLSDTLAELEAARAAGLQVVHCLRESGDRSTTAVSPYPVIQTFDDIGPWE